ncbi:peptidylprolyl isomerase [Litchfieldella qijiaojingensis]|uniref:Periplasmic chaperone PpiD n=1 Tax=Litchfieldella qijiaojingensis TaxID=980347 RepID=A0ABQ2YAQ0_9GAMM|nr:SurA N-terminal domain-containing protein [Halomonas qijiaojingensis]GGX78235.1 peptidylprolyl isomerase [Halomonas qijiaojingensis]
MLQSIRDRSKSWGAKIIIGLMVAAMALFGADALVGFFTSGENDVAKVNGQSITRQQVELEVQRAIRSGQVPPDQERALRNQVLNELITVSLLDQYTDDGGLHLSEEQLDQVIVSLPEFQDQNGRFSQDLFRNRLASAGYTPMSFRQALRVDMQRQQLQQGLAFSDFTLPSERERLGELQRQTRSFRYHILSAEDLEAPVEVSEAELKAYYEANAQDYRRPEQVRLKYVVVDRLQMAEQAEVDEQALRSAYERRADNAERRVSHIMVTFDGERSREEARARLEEVQERLAAGEDFATLAAEYSDDASTADEGGDLGVISRGFFGDAFEEAAFSLDVGQVSPIVETDNGLHLIEVTELDMPSFEELRDELRDEVALSAVGDEFNQRVQRLIDESFAADDLKSVAESLGLELHESDWVSRDGGEAILAEPGVMDAAFSSDVLEDGFNSEVIELDEDRRMVLRVADHREAAVLDFAVVRDQVMAAVKVSKQRDALLELARARVSALRDGEAPAFEWQRADSVSRQSGSDIPPAVRRVAFRLPHPQGDEPVYGHATLGNDVAIIALDAVDSGDVDEQYEGIAVQMAERLRAQAAIQALLDDLRSKAEIERL